MSPKEAAIGMGDPYIVYPAGKDFYVPQEVRSDQTLNMATVAKDLGDIFATRNVAHLKALNDDDYSNLLGTSPQTVLTKYPQVAALHWNILTRQDNPWQGFVAPSARVIIAKVAEKKYGANTWMPIPSGKFDPKKDNAMRFAELINLIADREGEEESGEGGRTLPCGAFSDEETGFLVCSGCAPTDHWAGLPVHIDRREYTEVMVPTIPALVSMMRDRPDQFTDGVVLSLLQTTGFLAQCQSKALASYGDRLRVDLV